jgi:hypothetical protein
MICKAASFLQCNALGELLFVSKSTKRKKMKNSNGSSSRRGLLNHTNFCPPQTGATVRYKKTKLRPHVKLHDTAWLILSLASIVQNLASIHAEHIEVYSIMTYLKAITDTNFLAR